jgi:hypothetical protein
VFKGNQYIQNFGTGGTSLVDVVGAPRVSFLNEIFLKNGDSVSEIIASNKLSLMITQDATDMTIS